MSPFVVSFFSFKEKKNIVKVSLVQRNIYVPSKQLKMVISAV